MDERFDLLSKLVPIGNLDLRRISWSSPAALLEKMFHSDAVREIRSWNPRIESVAYSSRDRSNRLDSRVYITQDRTLVGKAKTIGTPGFICYWKEKSTCEHYLSLPLPNLSGSSARPSRRWKR